MLFTQCLAPSPALSSYVTKRFVSELSKAPETLTEEHLSFILSFGHQGISQGHRQAGAPARPHLHCQEHRHRPGQWFKLSLPEPSGSICSPLLQYSLLYTGIHIKFHLKNRILLLKKGKKETKEKVCQQDPLLQTKVCTLTNMPQWSQR